MIYSVIIPTCNRNDLLGDCLECLAPDKQSMDINKYEVIVSDDSKGNDAKIFIETKYPWARWVEGPKKGPAANRNYGASLAKGEWLIFTDDDCLPDENWLQSYCNAISKNTLKVYEGLTAPDRPQKRYDEMSPVNLTGQKLWSCNFAIEKSFFFSIDGFDELFPYPAMEDQDLYVRIIKKEKILFVTEAKIIHPWRLVKPFKRYKMLLASHVYFARKHGMYGTFSYRFSRCKIFIGDIYLLSKELVKFSFKGTGYYLENMLFDFLIIFA
ncbi:MAG: glycosyltransferase family A protein [Chitinophagaceae bacterium]